MTALHLFTRAQQAAQVIDTALQAGRPVVITKNMLADLVAEIGSADQVMNVLTTIVERRQKPLLINTGTQTVVMSPSNWTQEKSLGYVAGVHDELSAQFGNISSVRRPR